LPENEVKELLHHAELKTCAVRNFESISKVSARYLTGIRNIFLKYQIPTRYLPDTYQIPDILSS